MVSMNGVYLGNCYVVRLPLLIDIYIYTYIHMYTYRRVRVRVCLVLFSINVLFRIRKGDLNSNTYGMQCPVKYFYLSHFALFPTYICSAR